MNLKTSALKELVVAALPLLARAFVPIYPTFINKGKKFAVSSKQQAPSSFKAIESSQHINSKTSKSLKEGSPSSSKADTQIVYIGDSISYLYTDENNEAFYVNAEIGSFSYPMLLDTGSPYLWVYGSNCTDSSCSGKTLYSTNENTQSNEGTFDLNYNEGNASGTISSNNVSVAGLRATNFSFGVATEVPDIFESYNFSGVLGLSANGTSKVQLENIVEFLKSQKTIPENKFALCMKKYNISTDENNAGLFIIGKSYTELYEDPMYTTSTLEESSNHWEVVINSIYIDEFKISFDSTSVNNTKSSTSRMGLIDSGTTSIILTSKDAITLHSYFTNSISDGTQYAIYCNSTLDIDLEIAGHNWTITPDEYLGDPYTENSGLYGYCVSNFQGSDVTEDGAWILGNLFLSHYYVEFNYESSEIGFAQRNDNVEIEQSSSSDSNNGATDSISSYSSKMHSSTASTSTFSLNTSSSTLSTETFTATSQANSTGRYSTSLKTTLKTSSVSKAEAAPRKDSVTTSYSLLALAQLFLSTCFFL